jgi:Zn-dependent protease
VNAIARRDVGWDTTYRAYARSVHAPSGAPLNGLRGFYGQARGRTRMSLRRPVPTVRTCPDADPTLRIGRLAGVPIGVHPLWLGIVALITLALGRDYFPTEAPALGEGVAYLLGLASALTLFLGILLHELGHAVVARRHGLEVEEIDLWLLGGVARMTGEPKAPGDELRFALAGPAVTFVLLAVFGVVRLVAGGALADWLRAFVDYQLYVNAAILVFNLLPAFPLDGGRVARSLLWRRLGDRERATALAARTGRAFGIGLVVLGLLSFAGGAVGGLWLALIGGFLIVAAGAEAQGSLVERSFAGRTAESLMSAPAVTLRGDLTVEEAVVVGSRVTCTAPSPSSTPTAEPSA